MITFFAPASRCLAAASRLVKSPVDSITTSTPRSFHGSVRRVPHGQALEPLAVDHDVLVGRRHVVRQPTQDRVVLQQVRQRLVVGDVVDPTISMSARARRLLRRPPPARSCGRSARTRSRLPARSCVLLASSQLAVSSAPSRPSALLSCPRWRCVAAVSRRRDHPSDRHRHLLPSRGAARAASAAALDAACGAVDGIPAPRRSTRVRREGGPTRSGHDPIGDDPRNRETGHTSRTTRRRGVTVRAPDERGDPT